MCKSPEIESIETVRYRDTGQTVTYVRWFDGGTTICSHPLGVHGQALVDRAKFLGKPLTERE